MYSFRLPSVVPYADYYHKEKKFPLAISGITKSNPKYDDTFFNIEDMVGESLIFSHESS